MTLKSQLEKDRKIFPSEKFKQINRNNIAIQNWRNDTITRYANKGHNLQSVIAYVDDVVIPKYKRYSPAYSYTAVKDIRIPSVKRDKVISKMENDMKERFR